jgi:membrane protein YqaA with SNARE-associated domain
MFAAFRKTTRSWLNSRWMFTSLGVASFLESIIVPIPLEAVLVPLMQKRRDCLWRLALIALFGCIAGAVVGYYVGYLFMETVGLWFVEQTGQQDTLDRAKGLMDRQGFWFILAVSVLPIPFQIAMLAAGATKYPVLWFLLATLISRSIRYFGLAFIVWKFGDKAEAFIKKHKWTSVILAIALIATFWLGSRLLASP